jgi:glycosyltransferase involved in cell wall biosynthesis
MVKKKIIIITHGMRIGGIERSLLGLLNTMKYHCYEVDLFLFIHDGSFISLIPKQVNLLPEITKYSSLLISVKENLKHGFLDLLLAKLFALIKAKIFCRRNKLSINNMVYFDYLYKYTGIFLPKINRRKEYDLAISFMNPHYAVINKVKSKKKIAWIHTDYSFFEFDMKSELAIWGKYDHVASISDSVTRSFVKQFPSLADKIVLIENILSPDFVRKQAALEDVSPEMPKEENVTTLCSVGRFTEAKNFDNVPAICKRLLEMGCAVRWYLIGYGGDENLIRFQIEETGMQERVIILGKKENPYPYMKACDIYVQPSRYEGKAVTVREAQILYKPVVITNYATSGSQLEDGVDGIVVPMDNEGCARGIKSLLENKKLQEQLMENCKNRDFGNEKEVEKIYKLI